jgi:hypothetical protein
MSLSDNQYTLVRSHKQIKIYINSVLHIAIKTEELVAIHSWVMGYNETRRWVIEFTTKTTSIQSEYDYIEKWEVILNLLDTNNIYGNI